MAKVASPLWPVSLPSATRWVMTLTGPMARITTSGSTPSRSSRSRVTSGRMVPCRSPMAAGLPALLPKYCSRPEASPASVTTSTPVSDGPAFWSRPVCAISES